MPRPEVPPEPWFTPPAPAAPSLPRAPADDPHEPAVVRVTIGRVDVRAVVPPAPAEQRKPRRQPRLTLEEYLRDAEGRRR
jgi:hypothetical protein